MDRVLGRPFDAPPRFVPPECTQPLPIRRGVLAVLGQFSRGWRGQFPEKIEGT